VSLLVVKRILNLDDNEELYDKLYIEIPISGSLAKKGDTSSLNDEVEHHTQYGLYTFQKIQYHVEWEVNRQVEKGNFGKANVNSNYFLQFCKRCS
jgi:hypothetical protein